MKLKLALIAFFLLWAASHADAQKAQEISNPSIDMNGYLKLAREAADHREKRRLTEDEFIEMSRRQGVIVLDARSKEKYDELHIDGAINLSFPDITVESLARVLPDKNATILIYCNNNFRNEERAFPTKMATASLNISTYIALYTYGYRNVYELGPLLDAETTRLTLVASPKAARN
jgi:phage shock protein E